MADKTGTPKVHALSKADFTLKAIKALAQVKADGSHSKGIHVVYSGYNNALKQYYAQFDEAIEPKDVVNKLVADGVIQLRPSTGGVVISPKGVSTRSTPSAGDAIAKILQA